MNFHTTAKSLVQCIRSGARNQGLEDAAEIVSYFALDVYWENIARKILALKDKTPDIWPNWKEEDEENPIRTVEDALRKAYHIGWVDHEESEKREQPF